MTPVTAQRKVETSRGETRRRRPAQRRVPAADGRALAPPRSLPAARPAPGRLLPVPRGARCRAAPERRTKGRAGRVWCPAPSPGLPVPRRPPLPGTEALTAPAPPACGGRRPRSCCRQSAAKRRPQLGPSARALAPPIVKGPAGGSAYKASAGAHAARRCQSRLAIQRGHPAPSNRRPAGPRCSAGWARARLPVSRHAASLASPARPRASRGPSPNTTPSEACLRSGQRRKGAPGKV